IPPPSPSVPLTTLFRSEEQQQFLSDTRPDKRTRLIDALLERPEFVDYWSYKWSDLLLISSRKLPQPAMRAFYQYVRQSVADNRPDRKSTRLNSSHQIIS